MIIEDNKIIAQEGKVFSRIIDSFNMGKIIYLGIDYSTGIARDDKPEYYIEIDEPIEDDNVQLI